MTATTTGWETVIGLEVHAELRTRDQAVLRLPQQLRRGAQHQHLPGLPRPARLPAGAQPDGGRVRHEDRHRPALPRSSRRSSTARTTSIPTCRRTTRSASTTSRSTFGAGWTSPTASGWASSGPTWRRTRARRPTSAAAAASTKPTTRWSTTTGPACPLVEIVSAPDLRSAEQARAYVDELRADPGRHGRFRREDGGGLAAGRRQRLGPPGRLGRVRNPVRDQEHELAPVPWPGHRVRGGPAGIGAERGWHGGAGDPALGRGRGPDRDDALQGGGLRLPVLPGARPGAGRSLAGVDLGRGRIRASPAGRAAVGGGGRVGNGGRVRRRGRPWSAWVWTRTSTLSSKAAPASGAAIAVRRLANEVAAESTRPAGSPRRPSPGWSAWRPTDR